MKLSLVQTNYPLSSFAVCLGAQQRAANRAAQRDYDMQLQQREADWMQQLSLAGAEEVQYDIGTTNVNLAQDQANQALQEQRNALISESMQADEANWKKFLQESQYSQLAASGRTGRSVERVGALDLADYLSKGSRAAYALTQNEYAMKQSGKAIRDQAKADKQQLFANVMWQKVPGLAPPPPVKGNVALAALTDGLKIASAVVPLFPG